MILLTGFEPFDGQAVNASWLAVQEVAARWTGDDLAVRELPVSFRGARQVLRSAVAELSPSLVIGVGEASDRSAVGVERVAVNLIDARMPDNDGSAPVDVAVIAGAPAAFFSTLPVRACVAAVRDAQIPVEVSYSAGTYVCNATFYALQHLLASRPDVRGGFVHVPRTGLSTDQAATALRAILDAASTVATDERVVSGAHT
ncbi:peptidase C15 [Cellulomonas sp. URHD0024]|uniref:pyroglutamyl-peptidase I family protein n=1 Tax=Cellulomonas sp. URHD0024 TaxID=1302620 RepID=UPI0003FC5428|nr:peptidase C15 [Cellulomonas sp. URHD0024]